MPEVYKAYRVREEEEPCIADDIEQADEARPFTEHALTAAREEGYQSGYSEGWSQCLLQEQAQSLKQTTALNRLIQGISSALSACRLEQSTEIANMVLAIAGQLFIHQQQDETAIVHQVTHLITHLNEKQHIHITLHPQDWTALQKSGFMDEMKHYTQLQFTPDEQLALGGCVMKSEHGVFDASIERQMENLKQVLLEMKREKADG